MAVPSVPGPGLAVVETEIILGAQEAVFDRPAQLGGPGEFGQRGARGGVGEVKGERLGVPAAAADQQPTLEACARVEAERDLGPVVEPGTLGAFAGRQRLPLIGFKSSFLIEPGT